MCAIELDNYPQNSNKMKTQLLTNQFDLRQKAEEKLRGKKLQLSMDLTEIDLFSLNHELLIRLGPEPLTDLFDGERLFQQSRGRSMAVKPFIMDNAVVVGVGNIYATEALFAAGIDPRREAKSISRARYLKLAIEIKRILAAAIERGGTTLRDFIGGDGQPGYFQQELFVYGRGAEPCKVCGTELREVKLGQRASVFCPRCQR